MLRHAASCVLAHELFRFVITAPMCEGKLNLCEHARNERENMSTHVALLQNSLKHACVCIRLTKTPY